MTSVNMLIVQKVSNFYMEKQENFGNQNCKKCSKTTKIWHFQKMTQTLHNGDVFANTTKNSGESKMYIYWDIDRIKLKF